MEHLQLAHQSLTACIEYSSAYAFPFENSTACFSDITSLMSRFEPVFDGSFLQPYFHTWYTTHVTGIAAQAIVALIAARVGECGVSCDRKDDWTVDGLVSAAVDVLAQAGIAVNSDSQVVM